MVRRPKRRYPGSTPGSRVRGQRAPEPTPLVMGDITRVPLTRDGFEIVRSPYQSSRPNSRGKIIDKVFHGKGPTLWRVQLRTSLGTTYSQEYVRCRTEKQAEQHIRAMFYIVRRDLV